MSQIGDTDRAVLNPLEDDSVYDFIVLAGDISPGLAEVSGAGDPRKWDKQDGHGATGATLKFNGRGLAEFKVKLTFWLPEHFVQWDSFKRLLDKPEKALDIWHPQLDELKIGAVVCTDRTQLEKDGDEGLWTVTISFTQFRKPKPDGGVPNKAEDHRYNYAEGEFQPPEDKYDLAIKKDADEIANLL